MSNGTSVAIVEMKTCVAPIAHRPGSPARKGRPPCCRRYPRHARPVSSRTTAADGSPGWHRSCAPFRSCGHGTARRRARRRTRVRQRGRDLDRGLADLAVAAAERAPCCRRHGIPARRRPSYAVMNGTPTAPASSNDSVAGFSRTAFAPMRKYLPCVPSRRMPSSPLPQTCRPIHSEEAVDHNARVVPARRARPYGMRHHAERGLHVAGIHARRWRLR